MMKQYGKIFALMGLVLTLNACSILTNEDAKRYSKSGFALLPLINLAQSPLAGEKAESILLTLLRSEGLSGVVETPRQEKTIDFALTHDKQRLEKAIAWARSQGLAYGITGSVEEWRYKSGLDGEPAVGISLRVIDLNSEKTLWSGSASRSGWSRESLTGNAHKVLDSLVDDLVEGMNL